jgi:hypothetical protein
MPDQKNVTLAVDHERLHPNRQSAGKQPTGAQQPMAKEFQPRSHAVHPPPQRKLYRLNDGPQVFSLCLPWFSQTRPL